MYLICCTNGGGLDRAREALKVVVVGARPDRLCIGPPESSSGWCSTGPGPVGGVFVVANQARWAGHDTHLQNVAKSLVNASQSCIHQGFTSKSLVNRALERID